MRNFVAVALFMAVAAPAAHAETVWNGTVGVRHMIRDINDGLESKNADNKDTSKSVNKRWEYRGSLALLNKGESVDFGFGIRTNSSQTSEWLQANNGGDIALSLDQAFGRYRFHAMDSDFAITAGRARTVMLYDNVAQVLFDNDTRWDGLGWSWKMGAFGFNAAQYILGATSQGGTSPAASTYTYTEASQANSQTQSHFGVLYGFQPHFTFKISDDITSLFAVSYLAWSNTGATATTGWYTNAVHGGTAGTVGNVTGVSMDNARQWQFLSDTALPFNLRFVAEYVLNKKTVYGQRGAFLTTTPVEASRDALGLSLVWGKPKKAGDFGLSYTYSNKGIGAVITTFSNGDIAADNKSHMFEGKYMPADALSLSVKAQFHKEKARLGGDGQALTTPNDKREQTQNRYEFTAALSL